MEKPRPKAAEEKQPAKKKSAEEAVEELEKRLAALGGPSPDVMEAPAEDLLNLSAPVAPPPAAVAPPPEIKEVKGGKNALLVRFSTREL